MSDFAFNRAGNARTLANLFDLIGWGSMARRLRWVSRRLVDIGEDTRVAA